MKERIYGATYLKEASGKARCNTCGCLIEKNSLALHFQSYRADSQIHYNTAICRQNNPLLDKAVLKIISKQLER
jgi:hypothetical protein